MTIFASNGTKLFISTASVDAEPADAAAYQALSFVECKELETMGSLGDSSNEISFATLSDGRTRRVKGTRDAGTMECAFGADHSDPGQIALIAAEKTIFDFAFKVVFNDAPDGGTPSERYFLAKVGSANEGVDGADNVVRLNVSLWVETAITRVDAAGP